MTFLPRWLFFVLLWLLVVACGLALYFAENLVVLVGGTERKGRRQ
jgi:hypothetical protein